MDLLTGQIVILAQPEGDEDAWMQILVFIVLAVFWAIGGIMKARAAKVQEKEEPLSRPQLRTHPHAATERFMQSAFQKAKAAQAKLMKPPAMRPVQIKAKEIKRQVPQFKTQAAKMPKLFEQKAEPDEKAETARATVEEMEVDIASDEQLRMAMLHYEIFGKCVAFRGPQNEILAR